MTDEFQSLALAARKGRHWLAEPEIPKSCFLQQLQTGDGTSCIGRVWECREKFSHFVDCRFENVANTPLLRLSGRLQFHLKNVRAIAPTIAIWTANEHIA